MSHSVTTTTAYPETTYTSNTYHQTLLRGFDELRGDAHLCDVTLIAGTSKYPVHRSLLAACSPYFRQMFTKDAASSTICRSEGSKYTWFSESIELRGISSEGLRHIVEFIYTGMDLPTIPGPPDRPVGQSDCRVVGPNHVGMVCRSF